MLPKGFKGLTGTINCDNYGDCADPKIGVYKQPMRTLEVGHADQTIWKPYEAAAPKARLKAAPKKK